MNSSPINVNFISDKIKGWYIETELQNFYHPLPEESGHKLKSFAEKNGGFCLGIGPFNHMTGSDIGSRSADKNIEQLKKSTLCPYFEHTLKDNKWTILIFSRFPIKGLE